MKGVMLMNFVYLIVFLFLYFLALTQIQNVMGIMEAIFTDFNNQNLWSDIPDETWFLLNLLLYIIVPIAAITYTVLSASPQQQQIRPY